MPESRYALRVDVVSSFRKDGKVAVYGKSRDIVTHVAEYGNVLIVADKKGERSAVKKTDVRNV